MIMSTTLLVSLGLLAATAAVFAFRLLKSLFAKKPASAPKLASTKPAPAPAPAPAHEVGPNGTLREVQLFDKDAAPAAIGGKKAPAKDAKDAKPAKSAIKKPAKAATKATVPAPKSSGYGHLSAVIAGLGAVATLSYLARPFFSGQSDAQLTESNEIAMINNFCQLTAPLATAAMACTQNIFNTLWSARHDVLKDLRDKRIDVHFYNQVEDTLTGIITDESVLNRINTEVCTSPEGQNATRVTEIFSQELKNATPQPVGYGGAIYQDRRVAKDRRIRSTPPEEYASYRPLTGDTAIDSMSLESVQNRRALHCH